MRGGARCTPLTENPSASGSTVETEEPLLLSSEALLLPVPNNWSSLRWAKELFFWRPMASPIATTVQVVSSRKPRAQMAAVTT